MIYHWLSVSPLPMGIPVAAGAGLEDATTDPCDDSLMVIELVVAQLIPTLATRARRNVKIFFSKI